MSTNHTLFSIFIPTKNRRVELERLLGSISRQSCQDFECIVVDGGSSDGTKEYLNSVKSKVPYHLIVTDDPGAGKHRARNIALKLASGKFFVTVDSDDVLSEQALQILHENWVSIAVTERNKFAGVEGLCVDFTSGKILGTRFPEDPWDSDHLFSRYIQGVRGDKVRSIRTEVFREFPFPEVEGEDFITESLVWNRIARQYRMRYVNRVVAKKEYLKDGLTSRAMVIRACNPKGAVTFYLELQEHLEIFDHVPANVRFRTCANLVRYSLHGHYRWGDGVRRIHGQGLVALGVVAGFIRYGLDRILLYWKGAK